MNATPWHWSYCTPGPYCLAVVVFHLLNHFFFFTAKPPDYGITTTPSPCYRPLDIVFVLARSASDAVWDAIKKFAIDVTRSIPIGTNGARYGAVTFGSTPQSQFFLNSFSDQPGLVGGLSSMDHPNTYMGTGILEALRLLLSEQFIRRNGDRLVACNAAIIVIDCYAYLDGNDTEFKAITAEFKSKSISLVPVGVDAGHNQAHLLHVLELLSRPPKTRDVSYFLAEKLTDLKIYIPSLTLYICSVCCEPPTQPPLRGKSIYSLVKC